MCAQIGLDPAVDIRWVTSRSPTPAELFATGKIDAFLGLPPEPQKLRARRIGHVLINSLIDQPWSQYFCCMLAGNKEFVRNYPVATKRVLRALLKAADLCVIEPQRQSLDGLSIGFTTTLRLCPADIARRPVRRVARVRCRGRDALSIHCDYRRSDSSSRARRRSLLRARTGASSTSSSAS